MKEIHFYTNLANRDICNDYDLDIMQTDIVSTNDAIKDESNTRVNTTQISLLSNCWYYISSGCRVFIHNDSQILEVKEHMTTLNGKDIRQGHNVAKLLLAGVFGELK